MHDQAIFHLGDFLIADSRQGFYLLDPDKVMATAERAGFFPTGEFLQLNSYENRVFSLQLEKGSAPEINDRVIAKFYRPQRWSRQQISEEHSFMAELHSQGIPVALPVNLPNGDTLVTTNDPLPLIAAFFPRHLGRLPDELLTGEFATLGRWFARLHNIGSTKPFVRRPQLGVDAYSGWHALEVLSEWVAPEVSQRYYAAAETLLESLEPYLDSCQFIRVHGDAHRGNLLRGSSGFYLIDFDDTMMAPASQDFWMLLRGAEMDQIAEFKAGYSELREFPEEEWQGHELLQGLRIILYSAWIARRWEDPSFPRLFPQFKTYNFWAEETEAIEAIINPAESI